MAVRLVGLTKRFRETVVVNNLDLEVKDGELFVLLGASGSGKSTVLRLIAGLAYPDRGSIFLNGRDVTADPPQKRNIGYLFQNYALFRHMTVAENIEYGLRIRGVSASRRRARREELLDLVGLSGLGDRFPSQLSGGQQQRVALARSLAYEPEVLLLDEPFGALDVKIRAQLRESFRALQRRIGVTTILVTHDQEEAFVLGDRIGMLDNGRLVEAGTPADLYATPRTARVARFVGGGNVLVGIREEEGIRLGAALLPRPPDAPDQTVGGPVRVLVRPEHVALSAEPTLEGYFGLGQGTVSASFFTGPLERTYVEFARPESAAADVTSHGPRHIRIESLRLATDPGAEFPVGTSVWVHVRDFHILEPPQLRVLAVHDGSGPADAAVEFGASLAYEAHAVAAVLAVYAPRSDARAAAERLEAVRRAWLPKMPEMGLRSAQGAADVAVIDEVRRSQHDLVVMGYRRPARTFWRAPPRVLRQLLEWVNVPVLLVPEGRPHVGRILIAVASDAPEPAEAELGALLTARLGAEATFLRIAAEGRAEDPETFEKRFVLAKSAIEVEGASSRFAVRPGDPAAAVLAEAAEWDADLIVLGISLPLAGGETGDALADAILHGSRRPLLLVPRSR